MSHTSSEATSCIFNGHNENIPLGALQLGHKVDQSLPSSAEILKWSYVSTPSHAFMATTGTILASPCIDDLPGPIPPTAQPVSTLTPHTNFSVTPLTMFISHEPVGVQGK